MSKSGRLLAKMRNPQAVWTWDELCSLLKKLGYRQENGDGSRVKFDNGTSIALINLHRPHPGNEVKAYVIRQVQEKLKNGGML